MQGATKLTDKGNISTVLLYKDFNLTVNTQTLCDFTTEIANNCPTGYIYKFVTYGGSYPLSTWSNAIVSLTYQDPMGVRLITLSTQKYRVCVCAVYQKDE